MVHIPIPKGRVVECAWGGVLFPGLWIQFSLSWVTDVGTVEILRKGWETVKENMTSISHFHPPPTNLERGK